MIMYGVYNVDTLEKLIQMVHKMNNRSIWYEKLYAGQVNDWYDKRFIGLLAIITPGIVFGLV